jgi:hypothetical protein
MKTIYDAKEKLDWLYSDPNGTDHRVRELLEFLVNRVDQLERRIETHEQQE